jgi:hypothetical protein
MTVSVLLNPPLERTRGQPARYGQGSVDARRSTARYLDSCSAGLGERSWYARVSEVVSR